MSENREKLENFGKFLMDNLRDPAILYAEKLLNEEWTSSKLKDLQSSFAQFSEDQKKIILTCVIQSIDNGIHDLLFAFQENYTTHTSDIKIFVDDTNLESISDGLNGEIFGEEGWRAKYSKYGENDSI